MNILLFFVFVSDQTILNFLSKVSTIFLFKKWISLKFSVYHGEK